MQLNSNLKKKTEFSKSIKIKTYLDLPPPHFLPYVKSKAKNYFLRSLHRTNKCRVYIKKICCCLALKPSFLNLPSLESHKEDKHKHRWK